MTTDHDARIQHFDQGKGNSRSENQKSSPAGLNSLFEPNTGAAIIFAENKIERSFVQGEGVGQTPPFGIQS